MKRLLFIVSILLFTVSCGKESGEQTEQKVYILDQIIESIALPNDTGSYQLDLSLKGCGFNIIISLNNSEAVLPEGKYHITSDINATGGCKVTLSDGGAGREVTSGEVAISSSNGIYSIAMDLVLNKTINYSFAYEGAVTFDTSITPSGNTILVTEGNVTTYNQYWQEVVVNGVSKYTVTVIDQKENTLAAIEFIGMPGKKLSELAGDYNVLANTTSPGTIVAGAINWGSGSGSFYIDDKNTYKYIVGGTVSLTCIKDNDGTNYYTISGSGLTTKELTGVAGTGSMKLKHIVEDAFKGEIIRNLTVTSSAMGRTMKYSIYLPGDYEAGKSFPILYLLHGYGDENNAWIDKGMLLKTAYSHEKNGGMQMIVVCPDGLTEFYIGNFETYMYEEFMPHIESTYKFNEKRAVAGLSMGGYGTLYYWSKYPEMYRYAYAMSPAVDVAGTSEILADKNKDILPALTIETGIQDYTTPLAGITEFHDYLVSMDIEHEFITRDGSHDWKFWQECLPKVLKKCGEAFKD